MERGITAYISEKDNSIHLETVQKEVFPSKQEARDAIATRSLINNLLIGAEGGVVGFTLTQLPFYFESNDPNLRNLAIVATIGMLGLVGDGYRRIKLGSKYRKQLSEIEGA